MSDAGGLRRPRRGPRGAGRWVGFVLLVGLACAPAPAPTAEEDHEHDGDHSHGGGIAVTSWTEASELFFEYPPLTAGEKSEPWAVHLTRLDDFSPVTEGTLTAAFRGPGGTVYTTEATAPIRPGIYAIAPSLPAPGSYDVVMVVEGPQLADRIPAGRVEVLPPGSDPPQPPEPPDGISFLKEQQWVIDFAVARAETGDVPVAVAAVGEIV
ncbi:MAG: hypothetical protein R3190_18745, partial [Thermoanaerobaculia bacterium]|nr:hypothetical protein [Thermoanaerobaculia bacterium]